MRDKYVSLNIGGIHMSAETLIETHAVPNPGQDATAPYELVSQQVTHQMSSRIEGLDGCGPTQLFAAE